MLLTSRTEDTKVNISLGLSALAILGAIRQNAQQAGQSSGLPSTFFGPPNQVLATPGTGGAPGLAQLRALVPADIPALDAAKITSGLLDRSVGGLGVSAASVTANRFYGGPASAGPAAAAFRALVAADIPALDAAIITSGILGLARGGLGVNASTVNQKQVFAGPTSGVAAAPGFRLLAQTDIPGISADLSIATLPLLNLTQPSGAMAALWQVTGAGSGTFWRGYVGQSKFLITYNASTADGATFTKDNDAVTSEVFSLSDGSEILWALNNSGATHSWAVATQALRKMRWVASAPMWEVTTLATFSIEAYAGGSVVAATAGQTYRFPISWGYRFSAIPTTFSVGNVINTNVTGTPTVTNASTTGAVLNVVATASADMQSVVYVQASA